jgi:hypothetical protein
LTDTLGSSPTTNGTDRIGWRCECALHLSSLAFPATVCTFSDFPSLGFVLETLARMEVHGGKWVDGPRFNLISTGYDSFAFYSVRFNALLGMKFGRTVGNVPLEVSRMFDRGFDRGFNQNADQSPLMINTQKLSAK